MDARFEVDVWSADEWDRMAGEFANANIYQSWHYGEVHGRRCLRSVSRAALLGDERCLVMAQFRVKRLPFGPGVAVVEWGPLFDGARFREQRHLLREFVIRAKDEYCERRHLDMQIIPRGTLSREQDDEVCDLLRECGFRHNVSNRPYRTVILDLSLDLPTIRRALDQKWRNQLNVAERAGMTLEIGDSPGMFDRFYRIYQEMWAKKRFHSGVRVPLIQKMQHILPEGRRMHITIVKDGREDVGATVCAFCGDTLLYYLGATSPHLRQNCRPGYLLQWSHITAAKGKGLRWYDTGGIPDDAPDILRFKTRMNGMIALFPGCYELPSRAQPSRLFSFAENGYRYLRRLKTNL